LIKSRQLGGLLGMLLLTTNASAQKTEPIRVTLVEARSMERCAGLDCPPWPVPPDTYFCFQNGDKYYTGMAQPWSGPGASKVEKLIALQGQTVEILLTNKKIKVVAPALKLTLRRTPRNPTFSLPACREA